MQSDFAQRMVLNYLIDFANGAGVTTRFKAGPLILGGQTLMKIPPPPVTHEAEDTLRQHTKRLLEAMSEKGGAGSEMVDAVINARGLDAVLFAPLAQPTTGRRRGTTGPAFIVPMAKIFADVPYVIVAIARCTATGAGDSLADRIALCDYCRQFFLQKTRQVVRICSQRCRNGETVRLRKARGPKPPR